MSEVCVDRMRLEHISGFIYLGYVLDESSTDEAEYQGKVGVKRNWWVLGQPKRERGAVIQGGSRGIDHPTRRRTQDPV